MLGPAVGGWMMAAGMNRPNIAAIMAMGSVLAAVAMLMLKNSLVAAPVRKQ